MSLTAPPDAHGFDLERSLASWRERLSAAGGRSAMLWLDRSSPLTLDLSVSHPGGVAKLLSGRPTRLGELVREPHALQHARERAHDIRARVDEVRADTGLLTGFLAAGLATWPMPGSDMRPCAPVLLRRCLLTPVDPAATDYVIDLGADLEINPALLQFLRVAHGLDLDSQVLAAMAVRGTSFDPAPVLAQVRALCRGIPGFEVTSELVVAPLSLAKHAAVLDVEQMDRRHPLTLALAAGEDVVGRQGPGDVTRPAAPAAPGWKGLRDSAGDPNLRDEVLVLDADARQHEVVARVLDEQDVVVHAPAGSGATQTLANVVAAAVGAGRRVILTAPAEADRLGVRRRLESVGLGHLLVDLHEGAEGERHLHELVLRRAQEGLVGAPTDLEAGDAAATRARMAELRERLVEHRAVMHDVRRPWGVSVTQAQQALAALSQRPRPPASRVRLPERVLSALPLAALSEVIEQCSELARLGAWGPRTVEDPWFGAQVDDLDEARRCLEIARQLDGGRLASARAAMDGLTERAGLPPAQTLEQAHERLELLAAVRETLELFQPQLFDTDLVELAEATAHDGAASLVRRTRARRQARSLLRPGPVPADLHTPLVAARDQHRAWVELAGTGTRPSSPPGLVDARREIRAVLDDVGWLQARLSGTIAGDDLFGALLDDLSARLHAMATRTERVDDLPFISTVVRDLRRRGLGPLIDDLAKRSVRAEDVRDEVELVWWASALVLIRDGDQVYRDHDGAALREAERAWVLADRAHQAAVAASVRRSVAQRWGRIAAEEPGQVRALERAAVQAPWTVGQWLEQAPDVLHAAAPVLVVAPLAAAAVLPRGEIVDLVVVDGADRLPVEQAAGVLSRGRHAVVVGDPDSPGPVPFAVAGPAVTAGADAPVSALQAASVALGDPVVLLTQWRARDERLVHTLNDVLHDGQLVTIPTPARRGVVATSVIHVEAPEVDPADGLEGHTVPSTAAEVGATVDAVLAHLEGGRGESLGVVTATVVHAERVRAALDALAGHVPAGGLSHVPVDEPLRDRLRAALTAPEPLVVLPVARAGALVRDAVIVSTGYAPGPDGEVVDHGGLLDGPRGQAWVARALSRARSRTTLVTGWDEVALTDLLDRRADAGGARLLRAWMQASSDPQPPRGREPEPLLAEFVRRLVGEGLRVVPDHGLGRRRIPLVVAEKGDTAGPRVAVLTDGPEWAAMTSTRERERLWWEQLTRLGWRVVRVHSTDVFRDPARDAVRVAQAVRGGGRHD